MFFSPLENRFVALHKINVIGISETFLSKTYKDYTLT